MWWISNYSERFSNCLQDCHETFYGHFNTKQNIELETLQGSDRIFDFFPLSFPDFSPEKAHDFRWSSWKILIFFRVKSWALHSSSNLIGNTNVCNSTETWRSMQLRNTIDEYTNFKQSSETKLLQWRKRTILIRQFKYCFSNF